jgi:hypothetical protein
MKKDFVCQDDFDQQMILTNRKFIRSVSIEQGGYLCLCGIDILAVRSGIAKDKIIAEIAPFLFNHPFGQGLPAPIVGPRCMEGAIEAAAQV